MNDSFEKQVKKPAVSVEIAHKLPQSLPPPPHPGMKVKNAHFTDMEVETSKVQITEV